MTLDIIAIKWNGKEKYLNSIASFLFPFPISKISIYLNHFCRTPTCLFLIFLSGIWVFLNSFLYFFVLIFPHIPLCPLKSLMALHFAVDCYFYRKLFISPWCIFRKKKPCPFFVWPWHCLLCLSNNLYLDFPFISEWQVRPVISNKLLSFKRIIYMCMYIHIQPFLCINLC